MGEETPAPPKTAKQLEKEAKKAAEKAAKLEKLAGLILLLTEQPFCPATDISAKQAKLTAAKEAKGGDEDKKEKKPKKDPGVVKEAAVYEGRT